jgi:DNA-binding XRE family transcriptional regulator
MIKTESAYRQAVEKLKQDITFINDQKQKFKEMGLSEDHINLAIQPYISFHDQLKEEVDYYERIKRGEFEPVYNLLTIGKTLIAYRIYANISQSELAERLNVSPSQVSRDERNEYYGATLEKIQNVMKALRMNSITKVDPTDSYIA